VLLEVTVALLCNILKLSVGNTPCAPEWIIQVEPLSVLKFKEMHNIRIIFESSNLKANPLLK
jgi:hypothetical protein